MDAIDGKRRRISPSSNGTTLFDLPTEALSHAASYLPLPSRALFALAINDAGSNDTSSAILSSEQWGALDFVDIEASLSSKITDDILREILVSINASTNLKKLKLAGCVNITGVGLTPLRGSVVLAQIDLSLVAEHKSPVLDAEPLISCAQVLPILDSIIEIDNNVLWSIVFPKSWRRERHRVLTEFMGRCNQMFERRNATCTHCDGLVGEHSLVERGWFPLDGKFYGQQSFPLL